MDGPGAEVEELAEEDEGAQTMDLAHEDLQDDGQLVGGLAGRGAVGQVDLEGGQLLGEEVRVLIHVPVFAVLGVEEGGQLGQDGLEGKVPTAPERMSMGGRDDGGGLGMTSVGGHDALGEEEVAEEGGDHEVLTEELLEEGPGQTVPGDGVGDGGEDPVELTDGGATVLQAAGQAGGHVDGDGGGEGALQDEDAEGDVDGGGEAAGEEIGGEVGVGG